MSSMRMSLEYYSILPLREKTIIMEYRQVAGGEVASLPHPPPTYTTV